MITQEQVEARLQQLLEERRELMSNLAAYNGAIQDCEYWLEVIQQEKTIHPPEEADDAHTS